MSEPTHIDSYGRLWLLDRILTLAELDELLSDKSLDSLRAFRSEMAHGTWRSCKDPECGCHYWGTSEYCCELCETYHKEQIAKTAHDSIAGAET